MYKRLIILSLIIISALCGLSWLGYRAVDVWAQGLEGMRIGEFAEVAEQIRKDVKRKLDEFLAQEQNRPYTDYQYYYVPDNTLTSQKQAPVQVSPLAGKLENGLSYNNFQINPDKSVTTPNVDIESFDKSPESNASLYREASLNTLNVKNNLLPILNETASRSLQDIQKDASQIIASKPKNQEQADLTAGRGAKSKGGQGQNFPIESLSKQNTEVQLLQRSRESIASNENVQAPQSQQQETNRSQSSSIAEQTINPPQQQQSLPQQAKPAEIVEVRIEPFVPVVVKSNGSDQSIFGGQVFMLRRVLIEDKQYFQGFQLNEKQLLEEVKQSTQHFIREGMSFEMNRSQSEKSAFTAVLDFGFGHLLLNLIDTNPASTSSQISRLRTWYFSILVVVFLVTISAVGSLWLAAAAQIRLARKKDDFVSAVSHELRTPLTAIRMHAEMLEKKWVKSQDKIGEYYSNILQESERLSRLIENVLDFSRIQRGKKKYLFKLGDINKCVVNVVEMMMPYATKKGFSIKTELNAVGQMPFDNDAVTQIVVNLLDNAVKYARNAEDKTIILRTENSGRFVRIEVEDHGPGIAYWQRKKVFQQFYRIGSEATRETAGSGLGLALVKKLVQAHKGFVEVIGAKPNGVIFRIYLSPHFSPAH